jgi:hypothetical protein
MIPDLRVQVIKLKEQNENAKEKAAEQYRNFAGEEKERLESISEADLAKVNPQAYSYKTLYHRLDNMNESLLGINGHLLDLDGALEQAVLEQRKPPQIELEQIYDHDPAPPTLSP